jgi:hypothetical protein
VGLLSWIFAILLCGWIAHPFKSYYMLLAGWGMSGVREVPFGLDNGLSHWVADGMIVSLIDFILYT